MKITPLEALNNIKNSLKEKDGILHLYDKCNVYVIEKSLKALEIIKINAVDVDYFMYACVKDNWSYEDYKQEVYDLSSMPFCGFYNFNKERIILDKEEYELLKEILK